MVTEKKIIGILIKGVRCRRGGRVFEYHTEQLELFKISL